MNYVIDSNSQLKLILHPEGHNTWRDYPLDSPDIALIIGPEGGLT